LISIKNSRDAVRHLVSVSNSTHFIVDQEFLSYAISLELEAGIVVFDDVSKFDDEDETFDLGLSESQREKELELPALYFHTSGSTGHPKIIPLVRA
jgi:long-subunit acyl-CoA synthetase (AMP-forming)